MINIRLTKLKSTHNNVRTPVVEGQTSSLPKLHDNFVLYAAPLTGEATFRMIHTTPVTRVFKGKDGKMRFETMNSRYLLEVL